jgi:ergothioneine biosynthesis protein EgtB
MTSTLEKLRLRKKATTSSNKKISWSDRYTSTRRYTEFICEPLATEDYVVQPADDVTPPKWHLAHTTWFFEEYILAPHYKNYTRFHPQYSNLFGLYDHYKGNQISIPRRSNLSRPTVEEIFQYRGYVDEHIIWMLQDFPETLVPILDIGLNHEQQHQERLFSDIKFILGHNMLFLPYKTDRQETPQPEHNHEFVTLDEGRYSIGNKKTGFAFEREHGAHSVHLKEFSIRKSLVTNHEYVQFIQDGGYHRRAHWFGDAWNWVKQYQIEAPLYWNFIDGHWFRYALSGLEKMNPEEPVTHISFYEAAAFADWREMRIPTEFEWEAAADQLPWGLRWEHTNSAYLPYPGYKKSNDGIGEHDGQFMINNMVLRGASVFTTENHSRKTYRNFAYPSDRNMFNGLRLCKK